MTTQHPQEKIAATFDYHGAVVELVEWTETIWCGKIGYAKDTVDEPDVEKIMRDFMALRTPANQREADWDVCLSVNYLSSERPNGVMFGFLVGTDEQPDGFELYRVPAARFMRIRMCDETAQALGREPWHGGIPPYTWISEQIAPALGFRCADDLPIVEYYGYYDAAAHAHQFCYLYVPVEAAGVCS